VGVERRSGPVAVQEKQILVPTYPEKYDGVTPGIPRHYSDMVRIGYRTVDFNSTADGPYWYRLLPNRDRDFQPTILFDMGETGRRAASCGVHHITVVQLLDDG
jgi:hypothetical protein